MSWLPRALLSLSTEFEAIDLSTEFEAIDLSPEQNGEEKMKE